MKTYDVAVENGEGTAGDTLRVNAIDEAGASAAALERCPEGWVATRVSDAADHGAAWGVDLTQPGAPVGPVILPDGDPEA